MQAKILYFFETGKTHLSNKNYESMHINIELALDMSKQLTVLLKTKK